MVIVEVVIKSLIDAFFQKTIEDLVENADTLEDSYLYRIFGDTKMGNYSYFENAKELFSFDDSHPRKIETHLFFNRERFGLPTIHIGLPGEQVSPNNGLGYDFMYNEGSIVATSGFVVPTHSRSFSARYNVICTSNNTFETLIMYNWLKAVLVGNIEVFEFEGVENIVISGNDILLNNELAPMDIYSRALMIDLMYEFTAPKFVGGKIEEIKDIVFHGIPYDWESDRT